MRRASQTIRTQMAKRATMTRKKSQSPNTMTLKTTSRNLKAMQGLALAKRVDLATRLDLQTSKSSAAGRMSKKQGSKTYSARSQRDRRSGSTTPERMTS